MGFEDTLLLTLFNFFECSKSLDGIIDEEYDMQLVDEDGLPLSYKEYLKKDRFYNDSIISCVYHYLLDEDYTNIDHRELVKELIIKYFVYHYNNNEKQNIIRFIKNANFESIYDLFIDRCDFGIELITSYYDSLIDEKKYYSNRGKILANDEDFEVLKKYDSDNSEYNSFLRESIVNIYNNYITNGFSDIEALKYTWAYFTHNFLPENLMKEEDIEFLLETDTKRLALSLIYADLYENAMNGSFSHSDNEKENIATFLPILITTLYMQIIPSDTEVRNRLLKHFILLQDDKEQMKSNRIKTYEQERVMTLKNYNPYFTSDEKRF